MESVNLTRSSQAPEETGSGVLVLQNGRQAGSRRPLNMATTFVGRSQGCDIRLNIDGVDAMHCALVHGPDGLVVRDLNSSNGTFVNGERVTTVPIRNGDILKIGPFQFRVDLSSTGAPRRPVNSDENAREAVIIQVAAVAAQQAALEEDESRLLQQRNDLQQQEQQLAAHLAEKQKKMQSWSEHIKAEREGLRRQKVEQQKILTRWESELSEVKENQGEEQERLIVERQRINKVYERLRQRWQRQWSAEKQKYQQTDAQLRTEAKALEARQQSLREQETILARESLRFNTERELSSRQLQENWEEFKKEQASWRRQQAQERARLDEQQQQTEEAIARMAEVRQLLQSEKLVWDRQRDAIQKELFHLNNRIVHQRQALKEQEDKANALDQSMHRRLLHLQRVAVIEAAAGVETASVQPRLPDVSPATQLAIYEERPQLPPRNAALVVAPESEQGVAIENLARELADQRMHLLEQYQRLAEIHDVWMLERDQAAQELEEQARQLLAREQALAAREQDARKVEHNLNQERDEVQSRRQEVEVWRVRLKAREQALEQDHHKHLETLRQQEKLLQEQLLGLTDLRQRWNRKRQEEIDNFRAEQSQLKRQLEEVHQLRRELFEKGQALEQEKRILADKTLAVETYRQEKAGRTQDPAAQQRIERLRRRWLMQNAAQLRIVKAERDTVGAAIATLQERLNEWTHRVEQWTHANTLLAEQQLALDERDTQLKAREQRVRREIMQSEAERQRIEDKYARMQDEIERMARVVYEDGESQVLSIEKAA
jgi:pSer/pThr/pTyr-binding forkhead associated (FHA) protein